MKLERPPLEPDNRSEEERAEAQALRVNTYNCMYCRKRFDIRPIRQKQREYNYYGVHCPHCGQDITEDIVFQQEYRD